MNITSVQTPFGLKCAKCSVPMTKHKSCSRCKSVDYCSRECQKAHWRAHKKGCKPKKTPLCTSSPLSPQRTVLLGAELHRVCKQVCCDGHSELPLPLSRSALVRLRDDVVEDSHTWETLGSGAMYGRTRVGLEGEFPLCKALYGKVLRTAEELGNAHSVLHDMMANPSGAMGIAIQGSPSPSEPVHVDLRKPKHASIGVLLTVLSNNAKSSISHFKNHPCPIAAEKLLVFSCSSMSRTRVCVELSHRNAAMGTSPKPSWVGLLFWFFDRAEGATREALEAFYPTSTLRAGRRVDASAGSQKERECLVSLQAIKAYLPASRDAYDDDFIETQRKVYETLVGDVSLQLGFEASHNARQKLATKNSSFQYGEIAFRSLAITIQKVQNLYGGLQEPGKGVYVDLGSGTGKSCVAAALMHNFEKAIGIELLEALHRVSDGVNTAWETFQASNSRKKLEEKKEHAQGYSTALQFVNADITTNTEWYHADLIYCNTLAFNPDLIERLTKVAMQVKPGCFFISSGNLMTDAFHKGYKLLEFKTQPYSWGNSSVYIHQRIKTTV